MPASCILPPAAAASSSSSWLPRHRTTAKGRSETASFLLSPSLLSLWSFDKSSPPPVSTQIESLPFTFSSTTLYVNTCYFFRAPITVYHCIRRYGEIIIHSLSPFYHISQPVLLAVIKMGNPIDPEAVKRAAMVRLLLLHFHCSIHITGVLFSFSAGALCIIFSIP